MIPLIQRGTYTRLLAAILFALLAIPLVGYHSGHPRWFSLLCFLVVLVAALEATQAERRTRMLVWSTGLLAILTSFATLALPYLDDEAGAGALARTLEVLRHATSVLFLAIVIGLLVHRATASGRITAERIVASVCAYLLLGFVWSEAYQLLAAIYGNVLSTAEEPAFQEYLYFSYVTLTTLGYGDILPVHPGARALAFLEAVTGVLYLATLVARLVAQHIAHEAHWDEPEDADEGQDDPSSDDS